MPKTTALLPYKPALVETVSFGRIATVSAKPPPATRRAAIRAVMAAVSKALRAFK